MAGWYAVIRQVDGVAVSFCDHLGLLPSGFAAVAIDHQPNSAIGEYWDSATRMILITPVPLTISYSTGMVIDEKLDAIARKLHLL